MRKSELRRLGKQSENNQSLIEKAETVGCLSCRNTYPADQVVAYEDGDAVCPKCTVSVVIPVDDIKPRDRQAILDRLYTKYFMS